MGMGSSGRVVEAVEEMMNTPGWEARLAYEYAGQPYAGVRDVQSDFKDSKGNSTLSDHFSRHGMSFASADEYRTAASLFLEKPPTPTTQTFVTVEGTYFRYDTATNEFGIMSKYGGISTYFLPEPGIAYWVEQIIIYGQKKGV
jgi:pyocin large subunit-like protein